MKLRSMVTQSLLCLAVTSEMQADAFKHESSVGLEAMRYFYKEPDIYQEESRRVDIGKVWMSDTGYLGGLHASYRLTWHDRVFLHPEGRILFGKHDYKTGHSGRTSHTTKRQISVLLYETRLLAGVKIPLKNKVTVTPYTGLGYRFKSDDSEKVYYNYNDGNALNGRILGYYRKSNYIYVPIGTSVDYAVDNVWSVAVKGEYDPLVRGWHYDRQTYTSPVVFKQRRGYGLKGEVSVSYLYDRVKISLSPYVHYWSIKNSNEGSFYDYKDQRDSGGLEPFNHTIESGLRVGVSF